MKHYLIKIVMVALVLFIVRAPQLQAAEADFSEVYVSITDAKSTLQDADHASKETKQDIAKIKSQIEDLQVKDSKEGKRVTSALDKLDDQAKPDDQTAQLSELTKALIAYEDSLNQSDHTEEIKTLQHLIDQQSEPIQQAIEDKDQAQLKQINSKLNSTWTRHEAVIRNKDMGQYGQIEVALMQLRVAVEKEPLNTKKVESAWTNFKGAIDQADQSPSQSNNGKYHAADLNMQLDKALRGIDNNKLDDADEALGQFISIWPYVEGQIQTKNIGLYNKIENRIPYYQSILNEDNKAKVKDGLTTINKEIAETVGKQGYTSWDVALIFLREGLEVLLIVMTLTTMTRQMDYRKGTASVLGGAVTGLVISLALAFLFIRLLGDSGVLREGMEAALGLVAVFLMFVVGIWIHRHSSAQRWNDMIQQMYDNAIKNRNLLLLGTIGLITVLREGVEVIVFYMGMIGEIKGTQFALGIAYALVILAIFALLYRFIVKLIPIYYIFKVLTVILFVMAFKMLGMSVQKLQLLNIVPRHGLEHVPTLSWIGFYPTVETIAAQVLFLILVGGVYLFRRKK
ncbi:FTR1 family protein [Staphylococcus auricularis]|uniref:FTR1 family protein n=1 Tax=Staphylococcus auricularis TaxID=29379 RepID=UPI00242F7B94|nr:FTR1 family protein [Staphylococcus auricularis]